MNLLSENGAEMTANNNPKYSHRWAVDTVLVILESIGGFKFKLFA
jgi:hypothetical protein